MRGVGAHRAVASLRVGDDRRRRRRGRHGLGDGLIAARTAATTEPHAQGQGQLALWLGGGLRLGVSLGVLQALRGRLGGGKGAPPVHDARPLVRAARLNRHVRCRVDRLRRVEGGARVHHEHLHLMSSGVEHRPLAHKLVGDRGALYDAAGRANAAPDGRAPGHPVTQSVVQIYTASTRLERT